jgi:hypothetical protein
MKPLNPNYQSACQQNRAHGTLVTGLRADTTSDAADLDDARHFTGSTLRTQREAELTVGFGSCGAAARATRRPLH